ncbi:MAG: PqqD family protein [Pyrinomonadaceae bacterium]
MQNDVYPQARSEDLVVQNLPGETLVYDLNSHKAHCLNETSAFIWEKCSGELSVEQILEAFESRFGNTSGRELVELGLAQLHERELLINNAFPVAELPDRRQMLKRIGLASTIAVPVIASLVAPQNGLAIAGNCVCTTPLQCSRAACPSTIHCNSAGLCAP